jgi:hypothetical protein
MALASGTSGSGYGSGTYAATPQDPAAEAYLRGQSMVGKRIACRQCAYPDGVRDTRTAQLVAARVLAGEFGLDAADRGQVLFYLPRRFGA